MPVLQCRAIRGAASGTDSPRPLEWFPSCEAVRIERTRRPGATIRGEPLVSSGWIGRRVARKEDVRFLTGRGCFTDDLAEPGAARALMVRSPHPHARILDVDSSQALSTDGVLAVLTGRDVEGKIGPVPTLARTPPFARLNRDGTPMPDPCQPPRREGDRRGCDHRCASRRHGRGTRCAFRAGSRHHRHARDCGERLARNPCRTRETARRRATMIFGSRQRRWEEPWPSKGCNSG